MVSPDIRLHGRRLARPAGVDTKTVQMPIAQLHPLGDSCHCRADGALARPAHPTARTRDFGKWSTLLVAGCKPCRAIRPALGPSRATSVLWAWVLLAPGPCARTLILLRCFVL